jgi:hypothetical protein
MCKNLQANYHMAAAAAAVEGCTHMLEVLVVPLVQ